MEENTTTPQEDTRTIKKCYQCRKEIKGNKILCKECLQKPREKGTSTLIIWDKV